MTCVRRPEPRGPSPRNIHVAAAASPRPSTLDRALRYAFSGVAFSAAKPTIDDLDWCRAPDAGLPAPDVVVFLEIPSSKAAAREGFGGERYETSEMQQRVAKHFAALRGPAWRTIDAARTIDEVRADVERVVLEAAERAANAPVGELWD